MNYKTNCPECGGNDYYVTPANGVGYCFHCGYYERSGLGASQKEHVMTHTVEEIRAFYKQAAEYYHSCLSKEHTDYLVSRGLTLESIQRFKLGYIPNEPYPRKVEETLRRDSGLYAGQVSILGGRISLPYLVNDQVVDLRGRDFDGDGTVKYKSPLGSGVVRGAVYPYNYADMDYEHIVTEGELKALVSTQSGLPAVALPGMTSWKNYLISNHKQTIVFDSTTNRTTRELTYKAIDRLAVRLKNPHVAFLPLKGKDKEDLDSFILRAGVTEASLIVNNAPTYRQWTILQRRAVNVY